MLNQPRYATQAPFERPIIDRSSHPFRAEVEDDDPDLRAAIEASLHEANIPKPSAPIESQPAGHLHSSSANMEVSRARSPNMTPTPSAPKLPQYDLEPLEEDAIFRFNQSMEQVRVQGGNDLSRYPAVNELYDKANETRPKLAMSLEDTGKKERELWRLNPNVPYRILQSSSLRCTTSFLKPSNCMISCSPIKYQDHGNGRLPRIHR